MLYGATAAKGGDECVVACGGVEREPKDGDGGFSAISFLHFDDITSRLEQRNR